MRTLVAVLVAAAATLAACMPAAASRTEVARLPSPDGALDVVVLVSDPGATGAPGWFVHLLPRGDAPTDGEQALRVVGPCCDASGRHYGLDVRWTGPREVTVRYGDAAFADPPARDFSATAAEGTVVALRVRPAPPL